MVSKAVSLMIGKFPTFSEQEKKEGKPQKITKLMCGRTFIITCYRGELSENDIQAIKASFEEVFYLPKLDEQGKAMRIIRKICDKLSENHKKDCGVTLHPKEEWTRLEFEIVF